MENLAGEAVKKAILGSAPERKKELEQLWIEHSPQVNQIDDKLGFSLEAGSFGLVLFNHKTMCKIWLLGFAAQDSFNLYLPYLYMSQWMGIPFSPNELTTEDSISEAKNGITKLFISIDTLKGLENIDDFSWPGNVPKPDSGKPNDVNGSMVFDLLCMASAYCFLHEFKHVQIRNTGEDLEPHEEEYECDKYAREFLLDKIEEYSKSTGYDLDLIKNKRGMAIALASVLLLIITPEEHWSGTESHPSIVNRIQMLVGYIGVSDNDYFWLYLSCLLISQIDHKSISVSQTIIKTQREYCLVLLEAIDSYVTSPSNGCS